MFGISGNMNWCWLIGHDPRGPFLQPVVDGVKIYLYQCDRCKTVMVFDRDRGWVKYK